jgi:DNA ligase 1
MSTSIENIPYFYPVLYGIDKNGKTKVWKASVVINASGVVETLIEFGFLGGKLQTASRLYTVGKNIGKKNETTPYMQAISETRTKWLDKQNKEGYITTTPSNVVETNQVLYAASNNDKNEEPDSHNSITSQRKYFPMLANVYEPMKNKKSKGLQFPCFIQPKLDGVRCIAYINSNKQEVLLQSRTGSYFGSMTHISEMLVNSEHIRNNYILDGELYSHSMPFEELVGLVKKKKLNSEDKEKAKMIEYHVYDIVDETIPFYTRCNVLRDIVETIHSTNAEYRNILRFVETKMANDINEFKDYFSVKIEEGYEGVMLRIPNGLYRCNYRSNSLLKYKEFFEAEYLIVGYKEGEGRDKGTVIWICHTPDGNVFSVRPKGTIENRRLLYEEASIHIGKYLTVIYQELSENGVPRFPVGKCIRDGY